MEFVIFILFATCIVMGILKSEFEYYNSTESECSIRKREIKNEIYDLKQTIREAEEIKDYQVIIACETRITQLNKELKELKNND